MMGGQKQTTALWRRPLLDDECGGVARGVWCGVSWRKHAVDLDQWRGTSFLSDEVGGGMRRANAARRHAWPPGDSRRRAGSRDVCLVPLTSSSGG